MTTFPLASTRRQGPLEAAKAKSSESKDRESSKSKATGSSERAARAKTERAGGMQAGPEARLCLRVPWPWITARSLAGVHAETKKGVAECPSVFLAAMP
eukprot:2646157-Rhodomonas_salina.1